VYFGVLVLVGKFIKMINDFLNNFYVLPLFILVLIMWFLGEASLDNLKFGAT
jgi:hypothetical protein